MTKKICGIALPCFGYLKKRLAILACAALVGLLVGQAGSLFWFFDLFSHFMVWYAVLLLLGVWATSQKLLRAIFAVMAIGLWGWLLWPLPKVTGLAAARPQTFLAYNLLLHNEQKQANAAWLKAFGADVMFLSEYTPDWQQALRGLEADYPYRCGHAEYSPFGLALYARQPVRCEVLSLEGAAQEFPYIRAELADGRVVYGIHPPPPIGSGLAAARDASLRQLAMRIHAERGDVLVLGDMNSTTFSPVFREFMQLAGLRITASRWRPTWRPGYLPIDHILIKGLRSAASSTQMEDWRGSDHLPLWIRW